MDAGRIAENRTARGWKRGAFIVLVGAVLIVSGCTQAQVPTDSASAIQAESFPGVYAQTIAWGECDFSQIDEKAAKRLETKGAPLDEYQCGTVEAPLDWNDPSDHRTIELAVTYRAATGGGEPVGTLFSNPGGPGGSGVDLAYRLSIMPGAEQVLEHYDILGFDPRGIGRSSPVDCGLETSIAELAIAECASREPLVHSMGTSQVARDMDLMRSLAGDSKMHYLGYSYGTVLGATYATLFPEKVGRMVLDSAVGAEWGSLQSNFEQKVANSREIIEMLETCATDYAITDCPIQSEDELLAAMDQLNEQPFVASDGTEISGDVLYSYLVSTLYGIPENREVALNELAGAMRGDQHALDDIVEAMQSGGAAVGAAGSIVRCHSFPNDPDIMGLMDMIDKEGVPRLFGGPEINDDTVQQFVDLTCDALPGRGDDITDRFSGSPDAPILVVGITGDHATPYVGSQRLVSQLGNARLLTLEGHGHTASFTERSSCVNDATTAYLVEGKLPEEDTVCQAG